MSAYVVGNVNRLIDGVSRYIQYILIGFLTLAYFLVMTMMAGGDISTLLRDVWTYIHLLFVTSMTVLTSSAGYDSAVMASLDSDEYNLSHTINDKITKVVNNNFDEFREYVNVINAQELKIIQASYLAEKQVNSYDELTEKQKRKYKKLKYRRHILTGFNLPLFSLGNKKGYKITYDATFDNNKIKRGILIKRFFSGILFGVLTVNLFFRMENLGTAFLNTLIMMSQMFVSYFVSMLRPITQLKHHIPKIVLGKLSLVNGFLNKNNMSEIKNDNKA